MQIFCNNIILHYTRYYIAFCIDYLIIFSLKDIKFLFYIIYTILFRDYCISVNILITYSRI